MKPENYQGKKNQPVDELRPNLGQSYCVPCARYFVSNEALTYHEKSKKHKQAMKRIRSQPFNHKDAEEAAKY
jgi:bud site selection protein 20